MFSSVDEASGQSALYLSSLEGQVIGPIVRGAGDDARVSPEGTKILFLYRSMAPEGLGPLMVYDLLTGRTTVFPKAHPVAEHTASPDIGLLATLFPEGHPATEYMVSPDFDFLATTSFAYRGELIVVELDSGDVQVVTHCRNPLAELASCYNPEWSPDNKRVAYVRAGEDAWNDPKFGVYVVPVSCFAQPDTCMAESKGPIGGTETFAWSPDSKYLALGGVQRILVFDSLNWAQRENIALPNAVEGARLEWSPDGSMIAYRCEGDVYVAAIEGHEVRRVTSSKHVGEVVGWLSVPYKSGIQ
jgi:WD40 repeat protein